jgi:hypothetical protein
VFGCQQRKHFVEAVPRCIGRHDGESEPTSACRVTHTVDTNDRGARAQAETHETE